MLVEALTGIAYRVRDVEGKERYEDLNAGSFLYTQLLRTKRSSNPDAQTPHYPTIQFRPPPAEAKPLDRLH